MPGRCRPSRLGLTVAALALLIGAGGTSTAGASPLPALTSLPSGADVSWPNCPLGMGIPSRPSEGLPMPDAGSQFVVVGLTNGPGFTANPCLAAQVAQVQARHLWTASYAVASFPTAAQVSAYGGVGTFRQRLARTGAGQANTTVRAMRAVHLRSPMMWVDVEEVGGFPWSATAADNNAFLDGVLAAYDAAGFRVGIYTYQHAWSMITASRRLPLSAWIPSGLNTRASALGMCGRSPHGGPVLIGQWVAGGSDHDVLCPGVTGTATRPSVVTRMFASS